MGKAFLVVALFAVVVYLTLRLLERRSRPPRPTVPPGRPLAPDDDPAFLRDLEQRRRRELRERDKPEPGDKSGPS